MLTNIMHNKAVKFITRLPRSLRLSAIASRCQNGVSQSVSVRPISTIYSLHTDPNLYPETLS